jgi:hypothetical protein
MSEFEFTYNKKVIITFDSYDHFYEHIRDHELYIDFIYTELTGRPLCDIPVPNALGGNDPISITWWCGQDRLEVSDADIPQWSEAIDGLPIRGEVLIPEQFLNTSLAACRRIGVTVGVPIDKIEIFDHPA